MEVLQKSILTIFQKKKQQQQQNFNEELSHYQLFVPSTSKGQRLIR